MNKKTFICPVCGKTFNSDEGIMLNGQLYCEKCYDELPYSAMDDLL